jgi:4-hydroxy-tetrahydrodipicolinate reductase
VGYGRINSAVAAVLSSRSDAEIVGVVTPKGSVAANDALRDGVVVGANVADVLRSAPADLAVVATRSQLEDIEPTMVSLAPYVTHVICTAEELAFRDEGDLPAGIRSLLEGGLTLVAAGLNPGWVFDTAPTFFSGVLPSVVRVSATRLVDISGFGPRILAMLGVGFPESVFTAMLAEGTVRGHLGFEGSCKRLCEAFRLPLDNFEKSSQPIVAQRQIELADLIIEHGQTCGIRQRAVGSGGGELLVEYDFIAHVDPAPDGLTPFDESVLQTRDGRTVSMRIEPGLTPVPSTASLIANSVHKAAGLPPGRFDLMDLGFVHP